VVIETKIVKQLPPSILAEPLAVPSFVGKTNQDLVNYIFDLSAVIKQCHVDKALLKSWLDSKESQSNKSDAK
jgi:hypothetical protein